MLKDLERLGLEKEKVTFMWKKEGISCQQTISLEDLVAKGYSCIYQESGGKGEFELINDRFCINWSDFSIPTDILSPKNNSMKETELISGNILETRKKLGRIKFLLESGETFNDKSISFINKKLDLLLNSLEKGKENENK